MNRLVAITGIGIRSPIGNSPEVFFNSIVTSKSGVSKISKFNASSFAVQIGGQIQSTDGEGSTSTEKPELSRAAMWCVEAAHNAVSDAGLDISADYPEDRVDIAIGISGSSIERLTPQLLSGDGDGFSNADLSIPVFMNPAAAGIHIARELGLFGEVVNLTSACSSSTSAIGYAMRLIEHGEADCVITGGADEGVSKLFLGAYGANAGLSKLNESPESACRPFDLRRTGPVFADASCVLVLERLDRALARDARIYCLISGYGASSECTSMYSLCKSEIPASLSISRAMTSAQINPTDIQYYNALGIGHPWVDVRETRMLKYVLGEYAYKLNVSSIKGLMGHPLGASGAVQAATCALSIFHKCIPPTANFEEADPECDLDYVPANPRSLKVQNALLYTLGNGGMNTALVLSDHDSARLS